MLVYLITILTSTVSCAYDSKLTICASFSPKSNNFLTIFQATDRDGGWLGTVNGHIHLNVKQECFSNSSKGEIGSALIIMQKVKNLFCMGHLTCRVIFYVGKYGEHALFCNRI